MFSIEIKFHRNYNIDAEIITTDNLPEAVAKFEELRTDKSVTNARLTIINHNEVMAFDR